MDCFEKRKQKGFLFTIGDEPTLKRLPKHSIESIMGTGQYGDYTAVELLEKARKTFNVYHLHIKEGYNGQDQNTIGDWKQLMSDNLVVVDNREDVSRIITDIVTKSKIKTQVETKCEGVKEDEIIL